MQRVRALAAFVADAYGERRIVAAGVVPAYVVESAEYHEPALAGHDLSGGVVHRRPGHRARSRRAVPRPRGQRPHALGDRLRRRRARARRPAAARARAGRHGRRWRLRAPRRDAARGRARRTGRPARGRADRRPGQHRVVGAPHDRRPASAWRSSGSRDLERRRRRAVRERSTVARAGSTSSTAARARTACADRTGGPPTSAACSRSRGCAARSASSTRSAPGWPTTSSPTPTSPT